MKLTRQWTRFLLSLSIILSLAWIQDTVFSPPGPAYTQGNQIGAAPLLPGSVVVNRQTAGSLSHPGGDRSGAGDSTPAPAAASTSEQGKEVSSAPPSVLYGISLVTTPIAVDDVDETPEDEAVTTDVMANDSVPGTKTLVIVLQPQNGEVRIEADYRITYMPAQDFNGSDKYAYQACNPGNLCASAGVTINVLAVNDPPVAVDDAAATQENEAIVVDVLANDADIDGDVLIVERVSQPQHGTAAITDDQQIRYLPEAGFHGEESFLYMISDGSLSAEASIHITVTPLQKPVANSDQYQTDAGQTLTITATTGVLANDVAPAGRSLTAELVSEPAHGELELQADGSFSYQAEVGFAGIDTFRYTASDGFQTSDPASVSIQVNPDQEVVVANNDEYLVGPEGNLEVPAPGVLENDASSGEHSLQAILKEDAGRGTLTFQPDGSFSYAPDADFIGIDTFTYLATDGVQESNVARVDLHVPDLAEPSVAWVSPALSDERFDVNDEVVRLMVSAHDNIGVAYVNFFRWDAVNEKFINIATVNSAPYEVDLNTVILNPGWNQIFARSFDTSGNGSLRQFIWLYQNRWHIYGPLVAR